MVLRVGADDDILVDVAVDDKVVGSVAVDASEPWCEVTIALPTEVTGGSREIRIRARPRAGERAAELTSYHYWFYSSS
jgi:hypothetical protein